MDNLFYKKLTYDNILAIIKAIESKGDLARERIYSENNHFANMKYDLTDKSTDKNKRLYRFILEKHNLKILKSKSYMDSLEEFGERLKCILLYLQAEQQKNEINKYRYKSRIVGLIQIHSIRNIDRNIQINRQKLLTYKQCNDYLDFLKKNNYIDEYKSYENVLVSDDEFENLKNENRKLADLKEQFLNTFKLGEYEFDSELITSQEFAKTDILKLVKLIYPEKESYKKIS